MTKDSSEQAGYTLEENPEDKTWPIGLVIDGQEVAQFKGVNMAEAVRDALNGRFYPTRRQRMAKMIGSAGLSMLSVKIPTPPHELDMLGEA